MSVQIIVDSTADMAQRYAERVRVVPLTIHFGDETLIDGVTIDRRRFYERLIETDVMPTTSQPAPSAFESVYDEVARAGDEAVVIAISSKLSGTCQSAWIAAEGREYIRVVDSGTASIGAGILAQYAVDLAATGMNAAELAAKLERAKEDVCVIGLLDTLEYLKKGGRISKTAAFAGGLLNIRPVLVLDGGAITMVGKARGSKQGNNLLAQKVRECGGVDFARPILLGYTGLSDDLLRKYAEDSRELWQAGRSGLECVCAGGVIGTHAGPGAIFAAFFKKTQR